MPRFEFRLQRYLSVKEQMEDQKELEYATALGQVEEEKTRLAELEHTKDLTVEDLRESVRKSIAPIEIRRYNNNIEKLKHMIMVQKERLETAKLYAEEKRLELVEAMKERKAIEIVKENAFEEYTLQEDRITRRTTDELISYKHAIM